MTITVGPCGWVPTHLHHCAAELAEWAAYSAATKAIADSIASKVLWASLGRQYGACDTIARPVIQCEHHSEMDLMSSPNAYQVYIDPGMWVDPPSGGTCCLVDPMRCRLDGPVSSVTSVTVDGAVIANTKYRLDDGWWLVRIDGLTWPLWQDIDLPSGAVGTFVVTYKQGVAPPADVLAVAGTLALEYARSIAGCSGTTAGVCRLPGRVKEIVRQGITIEMVDPTVLLQMGLTGIPEVDSLINALNPRRFARPLRVLVPEMTARKVSV